MAGSYLRWVLNQIDMVPDTLEKAAQGLTTKNKTEADLIIFVSLLNNLGVKN